MSEDVDQAQNVSAVEDNSPATPPVEEPTTSEPQVTEGEAEQAQIDEPAAEDTSSEERKPTRAERRIQQLAGKVRQYEQSNQQPVSPVQSPQFDVSQYADAEGNLDTTAANRAYEQNVVQTAQAIANLTVQQQLAQERAINNVERDAEVITTKYPELNPDSDSYIPELETAIEQEFKEKAYRVSGYDPQGKPVYTLDTSVRLADIAKRYTETARAVAKRSSADMKNAVARTADESAVRPQSGTSKEEKPFADLSIAEMEAKLGYAQRG